MPANILISSFNLCHLVLHFRYLGTHQFKYTYEWSYPALMVVLSEPFHTKRLYRTSTQCENNLLTFKGLYVCMPGQSILKESFPHSDIFSHSLMQYTIHLALCLSSGTERNSLRGFGSFTVEKVIYTHNLK